MLLINRIACWSFNISKYLGSRPSAFVSISLTARVRLFLFPPKACDRSSVIFFKLPLGSRSSFSEVFESLSFSLRKNSCSSCSALATVMMSFSSEMVLMTPRSASKPPPGPLSLRTRLTVSLKTSSRSASVRGEGSITCPLSPIILPIETSSAGVAAFTFPPLAFK